jgi:hypothetical protein
VIARQRYSLGYSHRTAYRSLSYNRCQSCKTNRPTMPSCLQRQSREMSRMVLSLPISSHRHPWSVEIDQLSSALFSACSVRVAHAHWLRDCISIEEFSGREKTLCTRRINIFYFELISSLFYLLLLLLF